MDQSNNDELGIIETEEAQSVVLQDHLETFDLETAIAMIEQHESELIKYEKLPLINDEDIQKMILNP